MTDGLSKEEYRDVLESWAEFAGEGSDESNILGTSDEQAEESNGSDEENESPGVGTATVGGANVKVETTSSGNGVPDAVEDAVDTGEEGEINPSALPKPGDGAEVTLQVNEESAQEIRELEEERTEQAKDNPNADPTDVFMDSRREGVALHFSDEDKNLFMRTIEQLINADEGSLWDSSDEVENGEYDWVWTLDINRDEKWGPFSPTKYDINDIIDVWNERASDDMLIYSEVFEIE